IRTGRPAERVYRLPDLGMRQDELLWRDQSDDELSERACDTQGHAQERDVRDRGTQAPATLPCGPFRRGNLGARERELIPGHALSAAQATCLPVSAQEDQAARAGVSGRFRGSAAAAPQNDSTHAAGARSGP